MRVFRAANLTCSGGSYVGARFGTFFACPPGVALSSGADCLAPGISPCQHPAPCGGHGPRKAG
eukprot:4539943-Prymnesium_polylepis.1